MTWIDVRSEEEAMEMNVRGTEIMQGLAAEPSFIGFVGAFSGPRGHTLTAWTSPQAAESAIARSAPHREGMDRIRSGHLGAQGFTSIWVPYRLDPQNATCHDCHQQHAIEAGATSVSCDCGAEFPVCSYL